MITYADPFIRYVLSATRVYAFPFMVCDVTDLVLYHIATDGTQTTLVYLTDYTAAKTDPTEYIDNGTVTLTAGAPSSGVLEIRRATPYTQPTNWVNNNELDMEILESSFDRTVMLIQQLKAILDNTALIANWLGVWVTAYSYVNGNIILAADDNYYICIENHTSGTWATDLAAGKWSLMIDTSAFTAVLQGYADDASDSADAAAASATTASGFADDASDYADDAAASALTAINAPGTSATDPTTSNTCGIGLKSFVIETGKAFVAGMKILVAAASSPANYMYGTVFSYNSGTGDLSFSSVYANNSGTFSSWIISLTGPYAPISDTPADGDTTVGISSNWAYDHSGGVNGNTHLGVGQTWTNVASSRDVNQTYTNDTGRPIQVLITLKGLVAGASTFAINGTTIAYISSGGGDNTISVIIPIDATYRLNNADTNTDKAWWELR